METFNFISYMENQIAKKLKAIGHSDTTKRFYKISGIAALEEYLGNLIEVSGTSIMVVENTEGEFTGNGGNYVDTPGNEFYVVQRYNFANHTERAAAKANCKAIGEKIIARMLQHKQASLFGLDYLQLNRVPYYTIGPFGDTAIACYFRIDTHNSANFVVNPIDWEE